MLWGGIRPQDQLGLEWDFPSRWWVWYFESLAWILGCKIGSLPSSYLGLPLGASYKSKVVREPVIERIMSKLVAWKVPPLSKGGRLTLVKATLATMPNYFLSLFTSPISVVNRMKSLFMRFVWEDGPDQHKYQLVEGILVVGQEPMEV